MFKLKPFQRKKDVKGINWWRYEQEILEKKLFPFTRELLQQYDHVYIQKDNAPGYSAGYLDYAWQRSGLAKYKMLWPPNSPDLNYIESLWSFIKQRYQALSKEELEKHFLNGWEEVPQETIKKQIKKMPYRIEQVIRLKGGNNYDD